MAGENSVLTAQIAIPEDQARLVYEADNYNDSTENLNNNSLSGDNVFGDNSEDEIAQQTLEMKGSVSEGYYGSVVIPIDFTAERVVDTPPSMPGEMNGDMPPMPTQDL